MRPTEPPIRWVLEFIPRGTAAGHEGDHVPRSSAEVTNEWSCACTLPACLHGMDRNGLTFAFLHPKFQVEK